MDLSETRSVIECSAFKEVFAATNIKNIFGPTSKTYSFLVPACRLFFIFRTGPKIPWRGGGRNSIQCTYFRLHIKWNQMDYQVLNNNGDSPQSLHRVV